MMNIGESLLSVPQADTVEPQEDGQQLNQSRDTAAVLQDQLIQAAERERQLEMQLDKMKNDVIQLQMLLEQQSNLQKEFDDFTQEQETKQPHSRFCCFQWRDLL